MSSQVHDADVDKREVDEEKEKIDPVTQRFLDWLHQNGARMDKILWPSLRTKSGIRGGIALQDIETNEHMLIIPGKLMLTPVTALDSEIGYMFEDNMEKDDDILVAFLMYERAKGPESFYWHYIATLPKPDTCSEWSKDELAELQDNKLVMKAHVRVRHLQRNYARIIRETLGPKYPATFGPELGEENSFEAYKFAWQTIQARAFGRRLPWSALVPFADCLNHGNVQTKYDYNVDSNRAFRLFPTGTNGYPAGKEVFNSYGRRPNANLLLDYGFALLDNEWDTVEIEVPGLPFSAPAPSLGGLTFFMQSRIRSVLHRVGLCKALHPIKKSEVAWGVLTCFRVLAWDAGTLEVDYHSNSKVDPTQPLSIAQELKALDAMSVTIQKCLKSSFVTTIEEDEALLLEAASSSSASHGRSSRREGEKVAGAKEGEGLNAGRFVSAVIYRLTRKRVLTDQLELIEKLRERVEEVKKTRCSSSASFASSSSSSFSFSSSSFAGPSSHKSYKGQEVIAKNVEGEEVGKEHGIGTTEEEDKIALYIERLYKIAASDEAFSSSEREEIVEVLANNGKERVMMFTGRPPPLNVEE